MKNKTKIILGACLGLIPFAIATSLIATSCNNDKVDPLAKTYQHEYQRDMSMFLDIDKKSIVKETDSKGNIIESEYCVFQDTNNQSQTYNGYYMLLRDTLNANEIIATFCGWKESYLNTKPSFINSNYLIPNKISLPSNFSIIINGEKVTEFPVKALGYCINTAPDSQPQYEGFKDADELAKKYISNWGGISEGVSRKEFFGIIFGSNNSTPDLPSVYITREFDLSEYNINYIFGNLYAPDYRDDFNISIKMPETLVFLGTGDGDGPIHLSYKYKNIILDLSNTKLVEITCLDLWSESVKIILPESCVRIQSITAEKLDINLDNILYYENYYISSSSLNKKSPTESITSKTINSKNDQIVINKDAKFFKESFPKNFEVIDKSGNKLTPIN